MIEWKIKRFFVIYFDEFHNVGPSTAERNRWYHRIQGSCLANRRATGPRFACRSSYIDPWFYKPAPRRGDDPRIQFSGAPRLRLPGDPVEVGPENMEESAHSVASVLEKEEVLDRMLTRLALTDDPKLETVLPKILPYSISCLSSGSPAIRKKVKNPRSCFWLVFFCMESLSPQINSWLVLDHKWIRRLALKIYLAIWI